MIEVYLLGVFVAYVKLLDLATIEIGIACYALGLLMLMMVLIDCVAQPRTRLASDGAIAAWCVRFRRQAAPLVLCETCGLVSPVGRERHADCPRCGARLHFRKPDSMTRTWALVLTAVVLYIPANVFPVMTVISFGNGVPDTISERRQGAVLRRHVAARAARVLRQHHRPGA